MALLCARNGARLILAARREDQLTRVAIGCRELGCEFVSIVTCDLSQEHECERLITSSVSFFALCGGPIDVLILNHTQSVLSHMDLDDPVPLIRRTHELASANFLSF